jgi:K+:H+ antiporter
VAFTLLIVRPLLVQAKAWLVEDGALTEAGLVVGLALMALGAWFTDLIGLHAVFGAFVMGAAMSRAISSRASNRSRSLCCFRFSSPTRA